MIIMGKTKQIHVVVTFAVEETLDTELFLESVEAACTDMLHDVNEEGMRMNWFGFAKFMDAIVVSDGKLFNDQ